MDLPNQVIEQRVRNRIIEYLEMVSNYDEDPPPWDLNETINQWEDWVPTSQPWNPANFPMPPFTAAENSAIERVNACWNVLCDSNPHTIVDEKKVFASSQWKEFVSEVGHALEVFIWRGRLSEDEIAEQDASSNH